MKNLAISLILIIIIAVSLTGNVYSGANSYGKQRDTNNLITSANSGKYTFYYFLHISDLHLGSGSADQRYFEEFANIVKNTYTKLSVKPLAVIDTGDITDDPEYVLLYNVYSYYDSTLDLSGTGIERLDTIGNHDDRINTYVNGNAYYKEYFGSPTYSYDIYINSTHYVRFIAINTTLPNKANGNTETALLDWLENKITEAENDPSCIAIWVFGHHPPAPNTEENVSNMGWDYKATPFNTITSGDPWRLVRIISSYQKVKGYIYGHVHENWVSRHYGKYWITTAPLTLPGPWPSSSSRWFNGIGHVYRIITVYNGVINTYIFHPGQFPLGFIVDLDQGAVLSGMTELVVFAASSSPITRVELYIDDHYYGDLEALNATSYGGLYHVYVNISSLSDWQHYFNIHVVDSNGNDYWSPRHYFYARIAGGVLFARSDLAMYSFDMRENYPVLRMYIYSGANENFPFLAIYVPVNNSGASIKIKTLLDTEHIPYNMRMRFQVVTWKEEPQPSDKLDITNMLKLVAGTSIEKDNTYPYDMSIWRQKGDPNQWWGDYNYLDAWWPAVGYWVQVTYDSNGFTVEKWPENESYSGPHHVSGSWSYYSRSYDYDDIRYAGIMVRSDTGYYSQVAVAYLEVDDAGGVRKYNFAPNIVGVPTKTKILGVNSSTIEANISVKVSTLHSGYSLGSGEIVLEGSGDGVHWTIIGKETISTSSGSIIHVFNGEPVYDYYRAYYKPSADQQYPLAVSSSQPIASASEPIPIPEPSLLFAPVVLATIIIYFLARFSRR